MKTKFYFVLAALMLGLMACDPDPVITNEEELITTVKAVLVDAVTKDSVTFQYKDLDGDGGLSPVIINGSLKANSTYSCQLYVLNEAISPAENINAEIIIEDIDHQFFYQNTFSDWVMTYIDKDINGKPLGLKTTLKTGIAGKGKWTIILRHKPAKSASNVDKGDITNAGGETDVEIVFDVEVK